MPKLYILAQICEKTSPTSLNIFNAALEALCVSTPQISPAPSLSVTSVTCHPSEMLLHPGRCRHAPTSGEPQSAHASGGDTEGH